MYYYPAYYNAQHSTVSEYERFEGKYKELEWHMHNTISVLQLGVHLETCGCRSMAPKTHRNMLWEMFEASARRL